MKTQWQEIAWRPATEEERALCAGIKAILLANDRHPESVATIIAWVVADAMSGDGYQKAREIVRAATAEEQRLILAIGALIRACARETESQLCIGHLVMAELSDALKHARAVYGGGGEPQ